MKVLIKEEQLINLIENINEINLGRLMRGLAKSSLKGSVSGLDKLANVVKLSKVKKFVSPNNLNSLNKFGPESLKNIENVLSKVGDSKVIKSASGVDYPISQIQTVLDGVLSGTKSIDDVKKFLPEKLADGTPFREVFVQNLSKKMPVKNVVKEIPDYIQNIGKLSDSLSSKIGSESTKKMEDLLLYSINKSSSQNGKFIKTLDGQLIPTNSVTSIIDGLSKGALKPDDVLKYLPEKLADGTSFRARVVNILSLKKQLKQIKQVGFDDIKNKFTYKNCIQGNCPDIDNYLDQMVSKVPNTKFNPSSVEVIQQSIDNVIGKDGLPTVRNIIEVKLENNQKIIMYSSSGSNVETTGKKAGEWFVIPGWGEDGLYLKTDPSIALTKGGNQYLTSMAKYLEKYGPENLG